MQVDANQHRNTQIMNYKMQTKEINTNVVERMHDQHKLRPINNGQNSNHKKMQGQHKNMTLITSFAS